MSSHASTAVDRAAAVRAALCRLVARQGFHGTSMSAVAAEAGVATGTAYVHYASKDDLVIAAYVDVKHALGRAATDGLDHGAPPAERFRQLWFGVHRHVQEDPDRARFLLQVDSSPYGTAAHEQAMATTGDPLMETAAAPDLVELLVPLPLVILYDLSIGPALRLAAAEFDLDDDALEILVGSCWRAITR